MKELKLLGDMILRHWGDIIIIVLMHLFYLEPLREISIRTEYFLQGFSCALIICAVLYFAKHMNLRNGFYIIFFTLIFVSSFFWSPSYLVQSGIYTHIVNRIVFNSASSIYGIRGIRWFVKWRREIKRAYTPQEEEHDG